MAQASKSGKQDTITKRTNKRVFIFRRRPGKLLRHFAAFHTVEAAQVAQKGYDFETFIINEAGTIV